MNRTVNVICLKWGDRYPAFYVNRLYDGVLSASQIRQLYTLPDTYPVPPAADISIPGSANTFMITTAGTFTFDATVKGNGGLDPKTNKQAPRIDKAGIAGVKVLWEVYEQGRAIKHDGDKYALSYAEPLPEPSGQRFLRYCCRHGHQYPQPQYAGGYRCHPGPDG